MEEVESLDLRVEGPEIGDKTLEVGVCVSNLRFRISDLTSLVSGIWSLASSE
jgi:hypothetical protein